jgi:hypothetical protein
MNKHTSTNAAMDVINPVSTVYIISLDIMSVV